MGKKKKKIENSSIPNVSEPLNVKERHNLIAKYLTKYARFATVTDAVLNDIIDNLNIDTASKFDLEIQLDSAINLYLCHEVVENENEDIIFLLEEQYSGTLDLILRKLGVSQEKINEVKEDILLELVYKYDGTCPFTIYFAKYAKEYLMPKKEGKKITLDSILDSLDVIKEKVDIDEMTFLGNQLQFINYLPLDDEQFVKFVAYKYGFLGSYVSDSTLQKVLNLDATTFAKYVKESYFYINQALKNKLGYLTNDEKEKSFVIQK